MMRDRVCFFVQSGKFCKREIIAVLQGQHHGNGWIIRPVVWAQSRHKAAKQHQDSDCFHYPHLAMYTHTRTHTYLYIPSSQSHTVICVQLTEKHLTLLVCLFLTFLLFSLPWLSLCLFFQSLFPFFSQQLRPQLSHTNIHLQPYFICTEKQPLVMKSELDWYQTRQAVENAVYIPIRNQMRPFSPCVLIWRCLNSLIILSEWKCPL